MLCVCLQKPSFSIVDRLLDPLRYVQLAVVLIYKTTLYLFLHKYWEITNIYHHGGVMYVPQPCPLYIFSVRLLLLFAHSHF